MASKTRLDDLFIVVSTTVDEERAAKVLSDAVAQIENGGGAVERDDDWHARPLAYEINHQGEGHYHLLQFTCADPALLDSLSFNLRVDDAVLRHRIIRNVPGTPPVPGRDGPSAPLWCPERHGFDTPCDVGVPIASRLRGFSGQTRSCCLSRP
jgi:ribosomal protein S6